MSHHSLHFGHMDGSVSWTLQSASTLSQHAHDWDAVNSAAGRVPFLDSGFILPLLREFSGLKVTLALCYRRSNEIVAVALVQRVGRGRMATYQPSQLPLGACLAKAGEDTETLAGGLLRALPFGALNLGLTQLDPLWCERPKAAPRVETLDYVQTAWIDVEGPFDAYWEARGKNLRGNMRKQRNKLEADGVALHFDIITNPADVPQAIADYGRLETAGWKAGEGTAVHPDNAQGRFYTEMLQNFCADGRGQIWRLKFGDKVVAMDLCIEGGGTLVILKTAYDPEYRTVSPAFLLKQEAFRRVFDEGRIRRIEFYGKLMEWHTRWTDNARMLYHANVYRWSWVPRARDLVRRLRPARAAGGAPATDGGSTLAS
jgi:hypothetical protein